MADLTNSSWSETDSSNTQPAPSGFPSGILPSQVGGVVRAMMGAIKRAYNHGNVMVSSTGSANAYVLTYEQPLQSGYVKGEVFRFFAHATNTGAATLNINGAGTRSLIRADGSALSPNEIVAGQVVTVVCDGTNFLHQSVGSRFFKDSVSITKDSDAVLSLEDTSAPATSYRRKSIYSTKNDGASGSNWLFRQTRPSDGAIEDFYLKGGTGGDIWTTGNFNPALKASLNANVVFNDTNVSYLTVRAQGGAEGGEIKLAKAATSTLAGDVIIDTANNSLRIYENGGAFRGVSFDFTQCGAQSGLWHGGNFEPSTKMNVSNPASQGTLTLNNGGVSLVSGSSNPYIYTDVNANNLVIRIGAPSAYRYSVFQADGFLNNAGGIRANGDLYTTGRVIAGEGQTASYIEMRDTNEGTRFVHNNSGNIGFLGSDGGWKFYVRDDGTLWSAQMGDINTRIEDRANAWSASRRDEANTNTANNYFNKTTGTQQNVNNIPSFNAAALDIVRGGVMRARWTVDGGGTTILQNGDNGDNFFYVTTGGGVWTKQFGDLYTQIENRSSAWARQESVARASERVAKTGDTMTGDLTINKAYPTLNMLYGGVRHLGWQVREDAQTYLWDYSLGNWQMRVDTGGGVVARGNLYAGNGTAIVATDGNVHGSMWGGWLSDRLGGIDNNANSRVAKTGDTMTGDLWVSKANPSYNFYYGGVYSSKLWVGNDAVFRYSNNDGDGDQFRISPGGAVWTKQFGDLNNRIEDRAYAWAATRQQALGFWPVEQGGGPYQSGNKVRLGWDGSALRVSIDGGDHERILHRSWVNPIIDIRLAYAGDLDNNWNLNASGTGDPYSEPYGGAVITTRYTNMPVPGATYWSGARWRYLQKQDSYGNWYTVGYV